MQWARPSGEEVRMAIDHKKAQGLHLTDGTWIGINAIEYDKYSDVYTVTSVTFGQVQTLVIPAKSILYWIMKPDTTKEG